MTAKSTILQILFFFLLIIISLVFFQRLRDPCVRQRPICVNVCHFLGQEMGCTIYHLLVWSDLNFLYISQWIILPTQSCLVLFSFCANLPHSLIMWLIVLSLSPHSLHLLYCWVVNIALIWLVLTALSSTAIRRDSVSLLRFPFLCLVQVFSCEMVFKAARELFFSTFLLPSYCNSIVYRVIGIISDSYYYYYYYYYTTSNGWRNFELSMRIFFLF